MIRRRFLALLGAATTAPLMPVSPIAATTASAPYSQAALHGAILHAKSSHYVSAWGLSKSLKISAEAADVLMSDLANRRIIAPVSGARSSSRWAASRVHNPVFARPSRATNDIGKKRHPRPDKTASRQVPKTPDTELMTAYLRDLSSRYFAAQLA